MNSPPYIETLPCAIIDDIEVIEVTGQTMAQIELREISRKQREDETLGKWIRAVKDKQLPGTYSYFTKEDQIMKNKFDSFKLI